MSKPKVPSIHIVAIGSKKEYQATEIRFQGKIYAFHNSGDVEKDWKQATIYVKEELGQETYVRNLSCRQFLEANPKYNYDAGGQITKDSTLWIEKDGADDGDTQPNPGT